jgi:hypothetical protein
MSSKPSSRPETMDRKNRKTFEMSRKIDAARDGAEVMSCLPQPLEVEHGDVR